MASKKGVLGKGLNALLPSHDDDKEGLDEGANRDISKSQLYRFEDRHRLLGRVAEIDVENVRPNPYQPRREFNEKALDELAASIEQLGIIQPVTVRALGQGQFEIISGERRLRAARRAGLSRLPAYVREADSEAMLEMALVENVQREELNPIEVAFGYQRLIEECDLTQEQVADKVGKSRSGVANMLRLLKLPPRLQAALRDGTVTVGHARALINVEAHDDQIRLLRAIEEEDLTVREVERRVRRLRDDEAEAPQEAEKTTAKTPEAPPAAPSRDDLQLEVFRNRLQSRLSTQVRIRHRADGEGTIEVAYYSEDDLERVLDLLLE